MGSTWNLPDGVSTDQIDAHYAEAKHCMECSHLIDGCCDFGICELQFENAFDDASYEVKTSPWEAAKWARDWATTHYVDEQEPACARFE